MRTYFRCPACDWRIAWGFDGRGEDPDIGLAIAAHVEAAHPEMVYGEQQPASWRSALAQRLVGAKR